MELMNESGSFGDGKYFICTFGPSSGNTLKNFDLISQLVDPCLPAGRNIRLFNKRRK
jgi:hypothetical protein